MKYQDPNLVDILAAEYVTGTLQGTARKRFANLMKYRRDVQARVAFWEGNLSELSQQIKPVDVPQAVWKQIESRIDNGGQPSKGQNLKGLVPSFWRTLGGFTSVAAAALLFILINSPEPAPQIASNIANSHIGLLGEKAAPLWVVAADLKTGELTATAINAPAAGIDQAFELWMLPTEGNPQSIGLLPVSGGTSTLALPAGLAALLRQSRGLAVSIEPAGGSPTGLPTGEVIQTTSIWEL